jgi:hypothetical protein
MIEEVSQEAVNTSGQPDRGQLPRQIERQFSWTFLAVCLLSVLVISSIAAQSRGYLQVEADLYLVDHLSDRPFLSKVICPHLNDATAYQARELSYVLDYLDAHFIYLCTKLQEPHFLSVTSYVLLFVLSMAHWTRSVHHLKVDPLSVLLCLLLFWTAPCIFFSGVYVRSAKPATSLFVLLLAWLVIVALRGNSEEVPGGKQPLRSFLWIKAFVLTLLACLSDQQGGILAALIASTLLVLIIFVRPAHAWILFSAIATALLVHSIHFHFVGPWLTPRATGFEVSFKYAKLPLWRLSYSPYYFVTFYLAEGVTLALDTFRFFFGDIPRVLGAFALACFALAFSKANPVLKGHRTRVSRPAPKWLWLLLFCTWVGSWVAMNILMVLRHPPLHWPDVRVTAYYWIPASVLLLVGTTLLIRQLQGRSAISSQIIRWILAALLVSNLFALPSHYRVMRDGHMGRFIAATEVMFTALRELYSSPAEPINAQRVKYDIAKSSRAVTFTNTLQVSEQGPLDTQKYLRTSHYYNFLRSKRGLSFQQPE